ncbi:MAG: nuclear transport factor 2 family protein [Burkholderiaceae bacterium]|nr:nuclear transport factor 2 family protein [Burkholderiaceae bacterium]
MRPIRSLILCCALCLTASAFSASPATPVTPAAPADVAAIQDVVRQFQAAIIAKDGQTLGRLFLADHNSWLTVLDDAEYAKAKARDPKVAKVHASTWKAFADFVSSAKVPLEERFYNVRIETNGAVASVYFDFDFLSDGNVTNRGSEAWQMVRDEQGWKIGAMVFSIGR